LSQFFPLMRADDMFPETGKAGLESWLLQQNEKYRRQQIPPIRRPFLALGELAKTFRVSIAFHAPVAVEVFEWFEANTKPGAHLIGLMFTGAFFYDSCFWPVTIPVGFGTFRIAPINALQTMPDPLKSVFWDNAVARNVYLHYWSDCFDYGYGIDQMRAGTRLDPRAAKFLTNGDEELRSALAALLAPRPALKAIMSFRMACEIFLKTFLIQEKHLTERDLKTLGHQIGLLAKECFAVKPYTEFKIIEQTAHAFPNVSDRYDGDTKTPSAVFDAVVIAQLAGATITRHFSGWDTRSQLTGTQP
jgi:hypothetical protein